MNAYLTLNYVSFTMTVPRAKCIDRFTAALSEPAREDGEAAHLRPASVSPRERKGADAIPDGAGLPHGFAAVAVPNGKVRVLSVCHLMASLTIVLLFCKGSTFS